MQKLTLKTAVSLAIVLFIALLHIANLGQRVSGAWRSLYYSYFSDLVLPFGFYFLLCASEMNTPMLRPWWIKALLVLGAACFAEILQFFGVYALGTTFDPLDIAAYTVGVLLAVAVEQGISAVQPKWSQPADN